MVKLALVLGFLVPTVQAADAMLYCQSEDSITQVLQAGTEAAQLAAGLDDCGSLSTASISFVGNAVRYPGNPTPAEQVLLANGDTVWVLGEINL